MAYSRLDKSDFGVYWESGFKEYKHQERLIIQHVTNKVFKFRYLEIKNFIIQGALPLFFKEDNERKHIVSCMSEFIKDVDKKWSKK